MVTKIQRIKLIMPVLLNLAVVLLPRVAFADGDTPVGQGLSYVINAMYGTTGIAMATLSIIAVGLLCLGHVLEWKRLIQTVIGVGIIFGAGAIVRGITSLVHNA
jgi:type IV secretory pathway VirB2 component (pilin)